MDRPCGNAQGVGCLSWEVGSLSTGTCSVSPPLAIGLNGPAWLSCVWLVSSSSPSSASPASTWCWSLEGALPMSRCRPGLGDQSDGGPWCREGQAARGPGGGGAPGPSAEAAVQHVSVGLGWGCAAAATGDPGPVNPTAPCRDKLRWPGWGHHWADPDQPERSPAVSLHLGLGPGWLR